MKSLLSYIRRGLFYEAVVEDGSDIIFIVDFEGDILYHNSSTKPILGYDAKSLVGKNFFDFILPETLPELREKFRSSQNRSYTQQVEFQFLCVDGTYRFLEFNAINLLYKNELPGFILDCRDITQRKKDAEELVRLQKAKEQFLANISHEIRTPINGIAGMANLLGQNPSEEERETYLNAIRNSAENLKVIINDILDLALIDSGKLKFEKIGFNLNELLPPLISSFTYQARQKKLELHYKIDPSLNTILLGDPVRLNQILINLVSNAVKFTHQGSIEINCTAREVMKDEVLVRIDVKDTGVGIPVEKLTTIFESFSQADESVTRKYGGSGLGLTIAKQLVELQGGEISVSSSENVGSTFTVQIPYKKGTSRNIAKDVKTLKNISSRDIPPLKVLLVEDNDVNRLYAHTILKKWNCHTDTAENGLVAIEKVKGNKYDVILMDIQMPVMDGFEATRAIRLMTQDSAHIPIVALTANATSTDIDRCLKAGMDNFLSKPFTPEDLYEKLFTELHLGTEQKSPTPPADNLAVTTPATDPAHKTYDLTYLSASAAGDSSFIKDIVGTFVSNTPEILKEMRSCLDNKNAQRLSQLAHKLKSSLVLLGMEDVKNIAMQIEAEVKNGRDFDTIQQYTTQLIESCSTAIEALRADFGVKTNP